MENSSIDRAAGVIASLEIETDIDAWAVLLQLRSRVSSHLLAGGDIAIRTKWNALLAKAIAISGAGKPQRQLVLLELMI